MFLIGIGLCSLLVTVRPQHTTISTADFNSISSGLSNFSLSLYQSVAVENNDDNVLISPFSAAIALGMVHAGAKGRTSEELKAALRLPQDNDVINNYFANLLNIYRGNRNLTLDVANKIYVGLGVNVLDTFQDVMTNSFKSASESINFAAPDAHQIINQWVEGQTRNKIQDLISKDDVGPTTKFILVNAVYFKADWLTQFKKEETTEKPFYLGANNKSVDVPMMKISTTFRYGVLDDMAARILELPYSNCQMSFFIILPDEKDGLATVEKELSGKTLEGITKRMFTWQLDAEIPKFKLGDSVNMVSNLKQLGIADLFDERKADLSGMSNGRGSAVSDVFHKTFIEVNEEGSKAAATTAIKVKWRSMPVTSKFVVDHPFLFFIRDNALNSILFIGRLMDPTK